MRKPQGVVQVARAADTVYIRIVGLGTMHNAPTFRAFVERMRQEGFRRFVLDLVECTGVDSTFMGVMLGVHQASAEPDALVVLNASGHCLSQMRAVGLDRVLTFGREPAALPEGIELHALPEVEAGLAERMRLMQKAHHNLVALDRRNEAKFGAFLAELDRQLGR
ncbi:MAG: hypothetical protein KatS3mg102_1280 [Planctomycetota bacterium]|nr:MAG: hypothetical protein KatS3mg102_1280 [Planctomycetota bacterium]